MEKILPIINVVLTVIAVVLCVVTLLTVNGVKGQVAQIVEPTSKTESGENGEIPLSQQTLYNMEKQFIFSYPPKEGEKKTTNVVVNIGFALNSEDKDTEDILKQFEEKQGIIRDRIQTMIKEKSTNPFSTVEDQQAIKQEILALTQKLFDTAAIIDVVFSDVMVNKR